MSGLTLGLMSLGLVDLEILQRSGTTTEKKQAGTRSLSIIMALVMFLLLLVDCEILGCCCFVCVCVCCSCYFAGCSETAPVACDLASL